MSGFSGAPNVSASAVGLGSVNNTADSAKPVSTAQQTALDGKSNTPSVTTRAAAMDTAYQPSATRPCIVIASVSIASGAAGDGAVRILSDEVNPPTTVRGEFRVGTALATMTGQLVCIVPAGHYYKLLSVDTGGTPTQSVVGSVQEIIL